VNFSPGMAETISVAMCSFNGERFLLEQLESIARQTRLPDELVVCDDCSSDSTVTILNQFARRACFPVRIFRNEENLGSTGNFERAIGLCRGNLIALCDQDDVWNGNKLMRLSGVLEKDGSVGGVFSDADLIDDKGTPIGKRLGEIHAFPFSKSSTFDRSAAIRLLLKHDIVTGATLMFRASAREAIGSIPAPWIHDGWIAWMLVLYSRLMFVAEPLVSYRVHSGQQLGVGRIGRRWFFTGYEDRAHLRAMARQFETLQERWCSRPGESFEECRELFDAKREFLRQRRELPDGAVHRMWALARRALSYERFGRGLRTMREDLFLKGSAGAE